VGWLFMKTINDWKLINESIKKAIEDLISTSDLEVIKETEILQVQKLVNACGNKDDDGHELPHEMKTILNNLLAGLKDDSK